MRATAAHIELSGKHRPGATAGGWGWPKWGPAQPLIADAHQSGSHSLPPAALLMRGVAAHRESFDFWQGHTGRRRFWAVIGLGARRPQRMPNRQLSAVATSEPPERVRPR